MKLFRKIGTLLPLVAFGLYLAASQHDNGILYELTPAQQAEAVEALDELASATEHVAEAMEEFSAHPDRESEMIEQLLDVSKAYQEVYARLDTNTAVVRSSTSSLPAGAISNYYRRLEVL